MVRDTHLVVHAEYKCLSSFDRYYEKVSFWMKRYEDFVGLTEVKAAQAKVVQLEKDFVDIQERRREIQMEMSSISSKLKEIHSALEKTYRGEDKYLTLITEVRAQMRRTVASVIYASHNACSASGAPSPQGGEEPPERVPEHGEE